MTDKECKELIYNLYNVGGCLVTRQLVEWCSLNIQSKRCFKQKQLYIHGPPNTLKTSFLDILLNYVTSYEIPQAEDFLDLWPDPEPELCYIDEFQAGKLTINWWNQFLQGSTPVKPLTLKQKGKQGVKTTNPPVIMLSNYTLEQNWAKALLANQQKLQPLLVRLTVVEVVQPLDIQGFKEALAIASYAYIVQQGKENSVSDLDLTNLLSISQMSEDSQEISDLSLSESPPSSPPLQKGKRLRHSTDSTHQSQEETSLTDSAESAVYTLLDQVGLTNVQSVTEVHPSYKKFKKYRRDMDDID